MASTVIRPAIGAEEAVAWLHKLPSCRSQGPEAATDSCDGSAILLLYVYQGEGCGSLRDRSLVAQRQTRPGMGFGQSPMRAEKTAVRVGRKAEWQKSWQAAA